jgi:hypothetical protein
MEKRKPYSDASSVPCTVIRILKALLTLQARCNLITVDNSISVRRLCRFCRQASGVTEVKLHFVRCWFNVMGNCRFVVP